jgi:hypothetical protein
MCPSSFIYALYLLLLQYVYSSYVVLLQPYNLISCSMYLHFVHVFLTQLLVHRCLAGLGTPGGLAPPHINKMCITFPIRSTETQELVILYRPWD